jgi:HrpE/YscL/FliH and V-type ATPase subunit E
MSFIARRITPLSDCEALPAKLVYRGDEIEQLEDAAAQIENARQKAQNIIDAAQRMAMAHESRFAREHELRLRAADAALLARATALEKCSRHRCEALSGSIEAALDAALSAALKRIALTLPAAERVRIAHEELRRQIGSQPAARLLLCAADEAACAQAAMALPWPVEIDETLRPGECRLVSGDGEWVLAFDAFVESVLECQMAI